MAPLALPPKKHIVDIPEVHLINARKTDNQKQPAPMIPRLSIAPHATMYGVGVSPPQNILLSGMTGSSYRKVS